MLNSRKLRFNFSFWGYRKRILEKEIVHLYKNCHLQYKNGLLLYSQQIIDKYFKTQHSPDGGNTSC